MSQQLAAIRTRQVVDAASVQLLARRLQECQEAVSVLHSGSSGGIQDPRGTAGASAAKSAKPRRKRRRRAKVTAQVDTAGVKVSDSLGNTEQSLSVSCSDVSLQQSRVSSCSDGNVRISSSDECHMGCDASMSGKTKSHRAVSAEYPRNQSCQMRK